MQHFIIVMFCSAALLAYVDFVKTTFGVVTMKWVYGPMDKEAAYGAGDSVFDRQYTIAFVGFSSIVSSFACCCWRLFAAFNVRCPENYSPTYSTFY